MRQTSDLPIEQLSERSEAAAEEARDRGGRAIEFGGDFQQRSVVAMPGEDDVALVVWERIDGAGQGHRPFGKVQPLARRCQVTGEPIGEPSAALVEVFFERTFAESVPFILAHRPQFIGEGAVEDLA